MKDISRLAVLDQGEPVVRVLAAVGNLNRRAETSRLTTVVLTTDPLDRCWYAREADDLVVLRAEHLDVAGIIDAVSGSGCDAAWLGLVPLPDRAALIEGLDRAGITVVGPDADTVRRLSDRRQLSAIARDAGLQVLPESHHPHRIIEIDVLVDDLSTVWTLGLRDASIRRAGVPVYSEVPAPWVPADVAEHLEQSARRLVVAAGYHGAGVVRLGLSEDATQWWLIDVDTLARPEHAQAEETTGASFVGLRLGLATGDRLPAEAPAASGHAVEVRLHALDPLRGFAPASGPLEMIDLPVGTGVRVDASHRTGDVIDGAAEPLVAMITAWGRDRREALERAHSALDRTTYVVGHGVTTRTAAIALLDARTAAQGPVTADWYDRCLDTGELLPAPDPLALIAAAVEAYESDASLVRSSFLASAARGRPEHPEEVGTSVQLNYRGSDYRLRVDRTGPRTYRVRGTHAVEVIVDRVGDFERRLVCRGRKHRLVAVQQGADIRLELDGVAHLVTREDGLVVRTGWPALVSALLVAPGDQVLAGQPVATLESMKMVSTVTAPFDGVVTSVAVTTNTQVERGEPLLRIKAAGGDTEGPEVQDGPDGVVDLSILADTDDSPASLPPADLYARLNDYLLGYDLPPEAFKALLRRQSEIIAALSPTDQDLLRAENTLLDLFADIGALYRPRTEAEGTDAELNANTQEFIIAYLQWLDPDQSGLPERYRQRLERAFSRYGVRGLHRSRALEAATVWLFRSFERIPVIAPAVIAILNRRLAAHEQLLPYAGAEARLRFERLISATEGRHQDVADLARDIFFHFFEEPEMLAVADQAKAQAQAALQALREDPERADRTEQIETLVGASHPVRVDLLAGWRASGPAESGFRGAILETYIRRYYRIRQLRNVATVTVAGLELGHADYDHEGMPIHLVVGYAPWERVQELAAAVAEHLRSVPSSPEIVVDIVVWRQDAPGPIEQLPSALLPGLTQSDFGRHLHRLDVTMVNLGGVDEHGRNTQHLTFRQLEDGELVEDELYRNLHPMLAKRMDLWRLSNFDLTRLPSPDDVYLFLGVARENPKDRRLFALAEVRDLVKVRDEETGAESYPRLGRVGLQALAAMRLALAQYPPRERPTANRLVLWVRPVFDVPPHDWPALAGNYLPLAKGAGLEKVALHVHAPGPDGTLHDKVLFVEGIGRTGTTIRFGDPGPNPIRPLTRYAQKVLTAQRFGTPYPYEIISMLTPGAGDPSPFPRGTFQELDLDESGERLVEVDREPAQNTAHLVVGLITTYTDVVPEGMTRLAILSDPTQGLGNLSEPECRRINAVLAMASERSIPVEWYAVSSGALIAMDSGTENMDWISLTLRRIIEFTQAGGEINIIVTGINVGGQPYWNAEATMLMHTRGILIMTPASTMVLTGKQALDFSGAVSADDNFGIGGYDRVMGPNGQAQYWAPSFQEACLLLLDHYTYTYVVPGERFPRRRPTSDALDRDVRESVHDQVPGTNFTRVGEVFDLATNPDRKQPFDMRSVMRAVADTDCEPLERWLHWQDAENSIVWDVTVGGIPVCMIGLSSRALPRKGFVPADGPPSWTSGTLFPQASRKTARAINATSGNRPLVVMANLSGFDGSPESMRKWQLEYGAEIGRAITNFKGPIVFVVVSRYHGGAFVVFSKRLTETMEIAAVQGAYASVIGGAPAAATVFAREVKVRTEQDPRVVAAQGEAAAASGTEAGRLRAAAAAVAAQVRSQKLGEVADEFDAIHTIERARQMGSVDRIVEPADLRPYVIDALERGMAASKP